MSINIDIYDITTILHYHIYIYISLNIKRNEKLLLDTLNIDITY